MIGLNSVDWMIAVVAMFIYSCFFLVLMLRPSSKNYLLSGKTKYVTLDLKDLGENDIVILEVAVGQMASCQIKKIHDSLHSAMNNAKSGVSVIDIPMDICKVSIIKRSPPKLDNSDLNELLKKALANTPNLVKAKC